MICLRELDGLFDEPHPHSRYSSIDSYLQKRGFLKTYVSDHWLTSEHFAKWFSQSGIATKYKDPKKFKRVLSIFYEFCWNFVKHTGFDWGNRTRIKGSGIVSVREVEIVDQQGRPHKGIEIISFDSKPEGFPKDTHFYH